MRRVSFGLWPGALAASWSKIARVEINTVFRPCPRRSVYFVLPCPPLTTYMSNSNPTPMLRQYQELKQQHPGTLLFFRLGDFYELFFDDAVVGSRELQITLTARQKESDNPIPMCGVPHHSAANYIARLVRKGFRDAICEQTEEASKTKKLVRREVVRIVTPGTPID